MRRLTLEELKPSPLPDRPDIDWPATSPAQLYEEHTRPTAGAALERIAKARAVEADATSDVLSALPEGTRADGLQWRVKSPSSAARKVASRVMKTGRPACDVVDELTDVLRYTAVTRTADELVDSAHQITARLTSTGWEIVEADHSYFDGASYKGLHVLARHPSGEVMEMQLHSEASAAAKALNHVDYEIVRDPDRPAGERTAARQRMLDRSAELETPRGLRDGMELGGVVVETKAR